MDKVFEELHEAKAEIERLKAEYKSKLELSGSLRRTLDEQLGKTQEANATINKQAQLIDDKMGEIYKIKQTHEELEIGMKDKEAWIRHLQLANDKLRMNCDEKNKKWEDEKRELLMTLEDTNTKNSDLERKVDQFMEETKRLKGLLVASEKNPKEAENKEKISKEFKQRDDVLFKLEEDYQITADQLKWKKEQFQHLEEAHRKLRSLFDTSKKEWEQEKSTLLDEISELQMNLDSQTRTSQDLQKRLKFCSESLVHEENRRKSLEIQLSETRSRFNDGFVQCEVANSSLDLLACQRDKDVATLRGLLGEKEAMLKEIEYQFGKLKEENQDLKSSLKELREAQIQGARTASSSSLEKLRSNLKNLEQKHKGCSKNLEIKESEWSTKLDLALRDLDGLRSDLEAKNIVIGKLEAELNFLMRHLEAKNFETSLMLMVLKSGISDVQLKFTNEIANLEWKNKEKEEKLLQVQSETEEKSEKVDLLHKKLETFKDVERIHLNDGRELEKLREQLKESTECQLNLKKQVMQMECDLKEVRLSLGKANEELEEKVHEGNKLELDMQKLRSIVEEQKFNLEDKQHVTEELKQQLIEMENKLKEEHLNLKKQVMQMECDLKVVRLSLGKANEELQEKFNEGNKLELEMQKLRSIVEGQKFNLEEKQHVTEELKQQLIEMENKLKEEHLELERASTKLEEQLLMGTEQEFEMQTWKSIAEKMRGGLEERQQLEKELLESVGCQEKLKQQIVQMEIKLKEEQRLELKRANAKLEEQFLTENGLEFEILIWKSIAEQMRDDLEERQLEKELVESAGCQDHLNKQVNFLESNLNEVHLALEIAKAEHAEMCLEGKELGFELQKWKCIAERLKVDLEENLLLRRQVEESLLAEIEFEVTIKQENENLAQALEMKERRLAELQQHSPASTQSSMACESDTDLDMLEQECMRRELEGAIFSHAKAEKIHEDYKNIYHMLVDEKDERISNLSHLLTLAEDNLQTKQSDINSLAETCEELKRAHVMKEMDIHEKKMEIVSLEEYSVKLLDKLQVQEKNLCCLKVERKEIVAELASKQSEIKNLATELRASNSIINQLESEKRMLVGDIKSLVSEREGLFGFIERLSSRIHELSIEESKFTGTWERIVQKIGIDSVDDSKENMGGVLLRPSPTGKKVEAFAGERSPFRALNTQ